MNKKHYFSGWFIVAYILGIGIFLAFGNGCSPENTEPEAQQKDQGKDKEKEREKNVSAFFGIVKTCSEGGACDQDALEVAYDKLDDSAIKELAEQKDGDLNVTQLLVKGKIEPKVASVIGKFLDKLENLDNAKVDEQLNHVAGGEDALAMVLKAGRPAGEDAGDLRQVLATIISLRPSKGNDIKDSTTGLFDMVKFGEVFAKIDSSKIKDVIVGLNTANKSNFLTEIGTVNADAYLAPGAAPDIKSGALKDFTSVYKAGLDQADKNVLHNALFRAAYGAPASTKGAVQAALAKVGAIVAADFLEPAELASMDFNPFGKATYPADGVKLLYAVLDKAKDDFPGAVTSVAGSQWDIGFVRAASAQFKAKIAAPVDWRAYITGGASLTPMATPTILELVASRSQGLLPTSTVGEPTAKLWLEY